MKKTLERMRKNGFEVVQLDTKEQAKDFLLQAIPGGASVGVGGTVSVRELDVLQALREKGCEVFSHWDVKPEDVELTRVKANGADMYLTSANALTKRGELILIDGSGNRVSAIAYGPAQVYFILSRSKWVDGGYGKAVARIKKDACPRNANRIGADTPCKTGACDADVCGDDCMCRMTLALGKVPHNRKMTVLLVDERLGY
jgi:hypothetical protein